MILEVKNLSLAYKANQAHTYQGSVDKEAGSTIIFNDISLEIAAGQQISLVGKSGSGKSSLLYLLAGFEKVEQGTIFWQGQDLASLNEKAVNRLRNQDIGFIFQFHNLLPDFTALENVLLPAMIAGQHQGSKQASQQAQERALELLDYMGLSSRAHHFPDQLSGGERQRVAIARALINNPKIILADEPTGNLDQDTAQDVMELLAQIRRDFNTAMLLVTHDPQIAESFPQQWRLEAGKLLRVK